MDHFKTRLLFVCLVYVFLSLSVKAELDTEDEEVLVEVEEEVEIIKDDKPTDKEILAKLLSKLDENGDGQITKEEIKRAPPKLVNQVRQMQRRIAEPETNSTAEGFNQTEIYWFGGILGMFIIYFIWNRWKGQHAQQTYSGPGPSMESMRAARLSKLEPNYVHIKQKQEERNKLRQRTTDQKSISQSEKPDSNIGKR